MKSKRWILCGGIGIFLLFIGIFLYFSLKEETETTIFSFRDSLITEVYSKVKISDFVQIENGTLEDKKIDTSELGENNISFTYYNNNGKKKTKTFSLSVIDTTPPLVWISGSYTIVRGNNAKLEDTVLCGDNYDSNPICRIEGEYSFDQVGEYPLSYIATDQSGNETKQDFILRVVEKGGSSSSKKISLEEVKKRYTSSDISIGIDVSKWQESIDWEKVKESGIQFAMIRLGTQIGPREDSKLDAYFLENIKGAQEVGIKVGVYYYSYASSKKEARNQAKWVVKQLEDYQLDLPVVFDWECYSLFNSMGISLYELNEVADTFLTMIEKYGYHPMMYGSKNYLEKIWTGLDYDVWLAHYTESTNYQGDYKMWQFTSSGVVPGISSMVDLDLLYLNR